MKSRFPSAQEYSAQTARYPALAVVDIRAEQAAVTESYRNQVLVDVNTDCMRLAVFEGEYRWHHHPDSTWHPTLLRRNALLRASLANER
jgi:hypothetical protein